jgi:undecaprenyl pyrophosphate synthase
MTPPIATFHDMPQTAPRTRDAQPHAGAAVSRERSLRLPRHVACVLGAELSGPGALHALQTLLQGAWEAGIEHLSVQFNAPAESLAQWLHIHGAAWQTRGVQFQALNNALTRSAQNEALETVRELRQCSHAPKPARTTLTLAIAYDSKRDLAQAASALAASGATLSPESFQNHMQAGGLPPVDLALYANGSARLQSFLLWHAAYAELCFSPAPWSAFDAADFDAVLADFAERNRTYGGLKR